MTNDQSEPRPTLRVGFVPGVTLTKWRTIWRERFPRILLDVVEVPAVDQRRVLTDGQTDLCFVRLPLDTDGLHLIRLYEEIPVAWVAKDHLLAAAEELTTADLDGEVSLTEVDRAAIDQVALGEAVLVVPQSIAHSHSRRDLVYRPITDAAPTTIGLAWLVTNQNPLIDEFVGVVRGRTVNSSRSAKERNRAAGATPVAAKSTRRSKRSDAAAAPSRRGGRGRRPR